MIIELSLLSAVLSMSLNVFLVSLLRRLPDKTFNDISTLRVNSIIWKIAAHKICLWHKIWRTVIAFYSVGNFRQSHFPIMNMINPKGGDAGEGVSGNRSKAEAHEETRSSVAPETRRGSSYS